LSCQAASTLLAGCCPPRELFEGSFASRIRATSALASPVTIATRELLLCPLSLAIRAAADRTAISLTKRENSCTVIPVSNIKSTSGSTTRLSAVMAVSLKGSCVLPGLCIITRTVNCQHLCKLPCAKLLTAGREIFLGMFRVWRRTRRYHKPIDLIHPIIAIRISMASGYKSTNFICLTL